MNTAQARTHSEGTTTMEKESRNDSILITTGVTSTGSMSLEPLEYMPNLVYLDKRLSVSKEIRNSFQ